MVRKDQNLLPDHQPSTINLFLTINLQPSTINRSYDWITPDSHAAIVPPSTTGIHAARSAGTT